MSDAETLRARNITRDELIAELRALRPVFERLAVTQMALVGSRARRDNRGDSDVDLMIDVDPARKFSLVEVARIIRAVEDRIGLRADVLMRRSLRSRLREAVDRDQVPVF